MLICPFLFCVAVCMVDRFFFSAGAEGDAGRGDEWTNCMIGSMAGRTLAAASAPLALDSSAMVLRSLMFSLCLCVVVLCLCLLLLCVFVVSSFGMCVVLFFVRYLF